MYAFDCIATAKNIFMTNTIQIEIKGKSSLLIESNEYSNGVTYRYQINHYGSLYAANYSDDKEDIIKEGNKYWKRLIDNGTTSLSTTL